MIYTAREFINGREARNGQNLGPQAKTPRAVIYGYASKPARNGRRSGIICPIFDAPEAGFARSEMLVFSENLALLRRVACAPRAAI